MFVFRRWTSGSAVRFAVNAVPSTPDVVAVGDRGRRPDQRKNWLPATAAHPRPSMRSIKRVRPHPILEGVARPGTSISRPCRRLAVSAARFARGTTTGRVLPPSPIPRLNRFLRDVLRASEAPAEFQVRQSVVAQFLGLFGKRLRASRFSKVDFDRRSVIVPFWMPRAGLCHRHCQDVAPENAPRPSAMTSPLSPLDHPDHTARHDFEHSASGGVFLLVGTVRGPEDQVFQFRQQAPHFGLARN